ncbi:MAG: hypothetical protein GY834_08270 [Bacteroidetes bacterium]|nr:hypothetical protein [Bacteroidota bacterium]
MVVNLGDKEIESSIKEAYELKKVLDTAARKDFNDNLSLNVSVSEGTATLAMTPLLVSQLRAIIGTTQNSTFQTKN